MTLEQAKETKMMTVLYEPMTEKVYAAYNSFEEALAGKYYISEDDYFAINNNVLWIALND